MAVVRAVAALLAATAQILLHLDDSDLPSRRHPSRARGRRRQGRRTRWKRGTVHLPPTRQASRPTSSSGTADQVLPVSEAAEGTRPDQQCFITAGKQSEAGIGFNAALFDGASVRGFTVALEAVDVRVAEVAYAPAERIPPDQQHREEVPVDAGIPPDQQSHVEGVLLGFKEVPADEGIPPDQQSHLEGVLSGFKEVPVGEGIPPDQQSRLEGVLAGCKEVPVDERIPPGQQHRAEAPVDESIPADQQSHVECVLSGFKEVPADEGIPPAQQSHLEGVLSEFKEVPLDEDDGGLPGAPQRVRRGGHGVHAVIPQSAQAVPGDFRGAGGGLQGVPHREWRGGHEARAQPLHGSHVHGVHAVVPQSAQAVPGDLRGEGGGLQGVPHSVWRGGHDLPREGPAVEFGDAQRPMFELSRGFAADPPGSGRAVIASRSQGVHRWP